MPFIDLSAPADPNNPPAPQSTAPAMPQLAATLPAVQPVQNQPADELGEHDLMKTMPVPANPVASATDQSGIKEIMGPPLSGSAQAVQIPVMGTPVVPSIAEVSPAVNSPVPPVNIQAAKPVPALEVTPAPEIKVFSPVLPVMNAMPTAPAEIKPQTVQMPANTLPALGTVPSPAVPTIELSGKAVGQEKKVEQILEKATLLEAEKKEHLAKPLVGQSILKQESAGAKFFSNRAVLDDFLDLAEEKGASDLHISSEYPPMLRIDGKLVPIGNQIMDSQKVKDLIMPILTQGEKLKLETDLDIDFSHSHKTGTRFRVNIFHKKDMLAGAFRLIPSRIRTIAELGLPEIIYEFSKIPHGLVLVTGPTGNGKSTTLASMLQEINVTEPKHIITIEDPIEYVFPKAKALVDQREVGSDVKSFTRALREVLRQDPNVVLVGEMRDFETIAAAITVAETGHLVFSTLHTNSASQSLDRIIDVFPDAQQAQIRAQLSNVIAAIISQRLVPISKGGRKAVLEIMIATPAIKNAIREAKTYQIDNMIQTSSELGMITLEKSLIELIRKGDLTVEDAQSYTNKPDQLLSLLKTN